MLTARASAVQQLSGLGGSGVDVSRLLTPFDTEGWNCSLYMFDQDVGFAEVLQRTAGNLPAGTLRLKAAIASLSRPAAGATTGDHPVTLTYTQPGAAAPVTLRCGALINTVAQTLPNLGFMPLDSTETALFGAVTYARYFTSAMQITPKLTPGMYILPLPRDAGLFRHWRPSRRSGDRVENAPVNPLLSALVDPSPYRGEVTAFFTVNHGASNRPLGVPLSADPGLVTAYSYTDVPMSRDEIAAKAVAMLSGSLRNATHLATIEHVYYPRVSEAELRGGWMQRAEAMQGRRATYHAGGLFTFWARGAGRCRACARARSSADASSRACRMWSTRTAAASSSWRASFEQAIGWRAAACARSGVCSGSVCVQSARTAQCISSLHLHAAKPLLAGRKCTSGSSICP